MNNLIFVVKHKKYNTPEYDPYKSIGVGKNQHSFDTRFHDDVKCNISDKNSSYCELTAQYWVWKNLSDKFENIGLNHYRRYFANSFFKRKLLCNSTLDKYLEKYDIILPKPWYWNHSVSTHYYLYGAGKKKDLLTTREAIKKLAPDYLESFDFILKQKQASYCNMLITSREYFDRYNKWLFNILNYVEKNTDTTNYTIAEKRIYGYLSEILLNVWVNNNNLKIKYLPMIEKELSLKSKLRRNFMFFKNRFFS
ncbi:MAG: DUF4422 domain-containing protein [Clostridium celatum]|nr:DUF4422 domain-containing protein [Clostridium celatum]